MTGPFCNDVDIFSTYEISQGFERTLLWIRTVDYICRGDAYTICRNFKAKCVGYLKGNKLFQFENIYGAKKDFNSGAQSARQPHQTRGLFAELKGRSECDQLFNEKSSPKTITFNRSIKSQNFNNGTKLNFHLDSAFRQVVLFAKRPNNPQISLLVNKNYDNKAFQYYQGHGALLERR